MVQQTCNEDSCCCQSFDETRSRDGTWQNQRMVRKIHGSPRGAESIIESVMRRFGAALGAARCAWEQVMMCQHRLSHGMLVVRQHRRVLFALGGPRIYRFGLHEALDTGVDQDFATLDAFEEGAHTLERFFWKTIDHICRSRAYDEISCQPTHVFLGARCFHVAWRNRDVLFRAAASMQKPTHTEMARFHHFAYLSTFSRPLLLSCGVSCTDRPLAGSQHPSAELATSPIGGRVRKEGPDLRATWGSEFGIERASNVLNNLARY
eukprot:1937677-Rhodomonas_salina.3